MYMYSIEFRSTADEDHELSLSDRRLLLLVNFFQSHTNCRAWEQGKPKQPVEFAKRILMIIIEVEPLTSAMVMLTAHPAYADVSDGVKM